MPSAFLPRAARGALSAAILGAIFAAGCAAPGGPPRIQAGTPCATCGMETRDLRWAAARRLDRGLRVYDSIECALRNGEASATMTDDGSALFIADFPTGALHRADSLWIVWADIPSPMGGGFAAFLDRAAAERVAAERGGTMGRLDDFAGATP